MDGPAHPDRTRHAAATRVAVVVVNYNTADLALDCLRSLAAERAAGECFLTIVVDNASQDRSAEKIRDAIAANRWGGWVELLPLEANVGFAAGNNAALRPLLALDDPPEYVLLLNPDTVVRPGAIARLVAFLDASPHVGLAGSRLEDPDGTPQRSAFRFPGVAGEFENGARFGPVTKLLARYAVAPPPRDEPHPADWLAGASLLVRREVFEQIGLLDDGFFLYFEEVDFCRRAWAAGWECWYVPASRVVHLVGQASGITDTRRPAKRVPAYWFAARNRYYRKHAGPVRRFAASAAWAVGHALWRARRRVQRKPDADPPHLLADFVRHTFFGGAGVPACPIGISTPAEAAP